MPKLNAWFEVAMRRLTAIYALPWPQRAALGAFGFICGLGLRLAFQGLLGDRLAYLTFYPATEISALLGGLVAGLTATLLGAATVYLHFVQPHDAGDWLGLATFLVSSVAVSGIAEALHSTWMRLDISEERHREAALLLEANARLCESEERYRRVSEIADVGLVRNSRDLIYLSANPAYAKIVGKPLEEIVGRPLGEVLGAAGFEAIRPYVERSLRGERVTYEIEVPLTNANSRWLHVGYAPDADASGQIVGWVASVSDVTERKKTELALQQSDRRKDEFLATLAHELRNPLAPVRNGLDALQKLGGQDPSVDSLLATMSEQVDHLIRLVDDLLDLSRISRGKFELQKQRMDLAAALSQAVDMCRHLSQAAGLDLRLNLPLEPMLVDGDTVRLTQVFANLLSNAARHSKRGGRIEITLEQIGDEAVASVADTGAGISKELMLQIFDPFVQGEGREGRLKQGLGIGLALVREITEMHGGAVEARSDGEGLGSTFIVRLPLLEAATAQPPAPQSAPPRLEAARRVLVIDDLPDVAESLAFLLRVLGAEVRVAQSGAQGLAICAEFEPELVFLDLSMPDMDGIETARRMREFPAGRRSKLVALTGFGEERARERTQDAGFDGHLSKPARLSQLEELLASVSAPAS